MHDSFMLNFADFNKTKIAVILTSIIFSLFHSNIIDAIYAFIVSFILIYVYEKYKTIKAPFIVHIVSNVINYFICLLITQNIILLNTILLIVSIVILFLIRTKIIKQDLYK